MIPWRHLRLDLVVFELAVLDLAVVSAPTETWSRIDSITRLLTPALARSSTLEYGRPATFFFAVAGPTPQRFSSRSPSLAPFRSRRTLAAALGLRCTFRGGGLAVDRGASTLATAKHASGTVTNLVKVVKKHVGSGNTTPNFGDRLWANFDGDLIRRSVASQFDACAGACLSMNCSTSRSSPCGWARRSRPFYLNCGKRTSHRLTRTAKPVLPAFRLGSVALRRMPFQILRVLPCMPFRVFLSRFSGFSGCPFVLSGCPFA